VRSILRAFALAAVIASAAGTSELRAQTDPLASWNDGVTKKAIVDFVHATTTRGSASYVAAEDRIATFDQDGTEPDLRGRGRGEEDRGQVADESRMKKRPRTGSRSR